MRFWTWFVAAAGVGLGFGPAPTRQNPAALYFKADARGQSCGRCHTPDGAEFRLVRFDVSDIIRRARQHLSPVEADSIGLYLVKDQVRNGLDPKIAPYQPGGEVLAGKTASERDEGLGKELSKKLPLLMGAPIRSLSSALAVRDEVLNIDPRDVKVGIQMSRISEDIFHGADHASLADWFPDVPVPETPAFLAAREAYRTDPSPSNLSTLMISLRALRPKSAIEAMSIDKYGALVLWADATRRGKQLALVGGWSPFWMVGEVARVNREGDPLMLGLPPDVLAKKSGGPKLADQMKALELAWMWMGWTLDPALTHSQGTNHATLRGDYFVRALEQGPYPIHTTFFLTKKLVEQGYRKEAWPYKDPQHFELQYTFFLIDGNLIEREPKNEPSFRRLALNSFRLSLYLVMEDVNRTGGCVRPESQLNQIGYIRQYFKACLAGQEDLALCDNAEKAIRSARVDAR